MIWINYRKLIGFSNGSYVVTMPKSWISRHNLKKGDLIGIDEASNKLIFYAETKDIKDEEKSISINAEDKSLIKLKTEIVTAYLNNYDNIEIFSPTIYEEAPAIKGIIRNLSGMEIIEQTGNRIVAKDLIDISSVLINSIIRRMDSITRSMIDDTILCIQGKCNPKSIIHRDADVNRLYFLGSRVVRNAMDSPLIMNKLKVTPWRLIVDRAVISRLEEIADRQKRVSRTIAHADFKDKTLEEFKEIKMNLKQRYHDAMKAYYTDDKRIAYEIETTSRSYIKKCDDFFEKISKRLAVDVQKGQEGPKELSRKSLVSASLMVEYTKSTLTFIKHIARHVLSMH